MSPHQMQNLSYLFLAFSLVMSHCLRVPSVACWLITSAYALTYNPFNFYLLKEVQEVSFPQKYLLYKLIV